MTNAFISPDIPVMIQSITGREGRRHTRNMRAYGTNIVAGVSPNQDEVDGIPVFRSAVDAARVTGARAAVAIVPPLSVLAVVLDAIEAGLSHIVTLAEGVPVHDAVRARQAAREAGLCWLGPSTPGLAIPNRTKLGFIPNVSLATGDLGIMSKSGTLSYEVCHRLVQQGLGQSLWVGLGGDAVKGMRFADVLPYFHPDAHRYRTFRFGKAAVANRFEHGDDGRAVAGVQDQQVAAIGRERFGHGKRVQRNLFAGGL